MYNRLQVSNLFLMIPPSLNIHLLCKEMQSDLIHPKDPVYCKPPENILCEEVFIALERREGIFH